MIFDDKYILNRFFLELEVLELLDFTDLPILNLEIDNAGTKFLSYLDTYINDNTEQRLIIPISDTRLESFKNGEISLYDTFNASENKTIYVVQYNIYDHSIIQSYLIPVSEFIPINPIKKNYFVELTSNDIITNDENLVALYATQRRKVILDFYLQSKKLKTSLQPWVFDKVLLPLQNIIGDVLERKNKVLNDILSYSQIRIASFKVSIEVEPSDHNINMFDDIAEYKKLLKVIELFKATSKEELETVIDSFKDEKFIKPYIQIVKAVIANDANINATLANPASKETSFVSFDKQKAQLIKTIIDEKFPEIVDIEDVEGVFLKLDFDVKEPTFAISNDEEEIFKGKVDVSILDILRKDKVNFLTDKYSFTIKTIYKPETTVNPESVFHYLMSYKLLP